MAAKTKPRPKAEPADGEREPLIPAGAAALLTPEAVRRLLGVGETKFEEMLRTGQYPRPDAKLGKLNRWTVDAHNAAVENLKTKG